jgi:hypothetical protein
VSRAAGDTVLVFPAGLPEALSYAAQTRERGGRVIGASSVPNDPARELYDEWLELPYIHDASFDTALFAEVERHGVGAVFSSHEVVLHHLKRLMEGRQDGLRVMGERAVHGAPASPLAIGARYRDYLDLIGDFGGEAVGEEEYAAVLARAGQFRGESGLDKLAALMALVAAAPRGDLVEVGVLSGRSAFILAWLARRYGVGSTLCVDPWGQADAMQWDSPEVLRKATSETDFGRFFAEFKANLIPSFHGTLNYIREASHDAARRYGPGLEVGPTEFGRSRYEGRIAVLHIDGNHDRAAAQRDLDDWTPHVVGGGWIVVDDYVWPFGDGPQLAGDRLLSTWGGDVARAFVLSGALFLQRR